MTPSEHTVQSILDELQSLGRPGYRKILLNHGVAQPCWGVKIEELKTIQKRIKKDYHLALKLYETGIYDAMYLAGLIVDDAQMTRDDLRRWVAHSRGPLAGSIVPWVAAGSPHGREMALAWMESVQDFVAGAGWATYGSLVAIRADAELDMAELTRLLERVRRTIRQVPDVVRYQMNAFLIAVGCHVKPLTGLALQVGEELGPLTIDLGNTACQVPFAPESIHKMEGRGALGKKRRSARC